MEKLLKNACEQMDINIDDCQIEKFINYKRILLEWNKKINLTAITDKREIILKHFVDCITILKFRNFDNKSVIDVGTGAGFPGVVLKVMQQNMNLTLLDSLNKRINFLQALSEELSLKNIQFLHLRAEQGGHDKALRESFDFCTSRAVANLAVLAEYTLPFVKVGGEFIALKGSNIIDEINLSKKAIATLGGEITKIENITIPFTDICHSIIFIKKIRQTPKNYPRKGTKISKNPIN